MNQISTRLHFLVETSHLVNVTNEIHSSSLKGIRRVIQGIADERDFGEISYRYELDDADQVTAIHAYFISRGGSKMRFMRLRRIEQ